MFQIPSDYEELCKPTRYCESDDPEIVELSKKITNNKKTPREAAQALFEWVRDNIKYDIAAILGAKEVLKKKSSCCVGKTNLFVALCRAIGIPTRYIMFKCNLKSTIKDLSTSVVRHVAAEIYVDRKWIIVDPAYEKSVGKMYEPSKFGVPTWTKWWDVQRVKSLPRGFSFLQKLFFASNSEVKKVRNILKGIRNQ